MITEAVREMITCPLSMQIFHTPVLLHGTGRVVEKEMADELIKKKPVLNPWTRQPILGTYEEDYRTKSFVATILEENPDLREEQYVPAVSQIAQIAAPAQSAVAVAAPVSAVVAPPVVQLAVVPAPSELIRAETMPAAVPQIPIAQQNIFSERREERLIGMPMIIAIASDIPSPQASFDDHSEVLLKVLCLGDTGSDKTQFTNCASSMNPSYYKAAIGVDFRLLVVHDAESHTTLRFQLWDIAGQERFGNMTRIHYKEAGMALFFDVEGQRGEGIQHWIRDVSFKLNSEEGRRANIKFFIISYGDDHIELTPLNEERRGLPFSSVINYVSRSTAWRLGKELLAEAYRVSQHLRTEAEAAVVVAPVLPAAAPEESDRGCVIA